jgi:hypothetical protein
MMHPLDRHRPPLVNISVGAIVRLHQSYIDSSSKGIMRK